MHKDKDNQLEHYGHRYGWNLSWISYTPLTGSSYLSSLSSSYENHWFEFSQRVIKKKEKKAIKVFG